MPGQWLPAEIPLKPGDGILRFLREPGAGDPEVVEAEEIEEEERGEGGIFCRRCGHRVTGEASRIAVNGSHTHAFFNPAGILFELGCFRKAPGCSVHGEASSEFSWFAGYRWRIALCGQCAAHLGWRFENRDAAFFCLILSHLAEGH